MPVDKEFPTIDQDPRKAAVLSGSAIVVRGLLDMIREYCNGPGSSLAIECELGNRLIEAGEALQRYGLAVRDGQVGQIGQRRQ
jgi:hypothetical protein